MPTTGPLPSDDSVTPPAPPAPPAADGKGFEATRWSVVLAARGNDSSARPALEHLCTRYWYPVFAFVRRRCGNPQDAHDLTQAFFAELLEPGWLDGVDPGRGRFRSFVLAAVKHFLSHERDRGRAVKRGGGRSPVSLDALSAEARYAVEPADHLTPDRVFERRWALALLDQVLGRLREEQTAGGRGALFEALKPVLTGQGAPYARVSRELGMSAGAVKVAAHRLRLRYRQLIREEVAQTVDDPAEVEEELRSLLSALGA